MATFPPDTLAALADREEIVIETSAPSGGEEATHRAIIWVVAEGKDVFVRSVRGEKGRWYRELLADPKAVVHFRGKPKLPPVPVRAVIAADAESIARFNRALVAKYTGIPGLKPMQQPDTFPATFRLEPA